mgnify:CR=1 FL=1
MIMDRDYTIELGKKDYIGLFIQLRKSEMELDPVCGTLFKKMEKKLFNILTIEEYENIEHLYRSMVR